MNARARRAGGLRARIRSALLLAGLVSGCTSAAPDAPGARGHTAAQERLETAFPAVYEELLQQVVSETPLRNALADPELPFLVRNADVLEAAYAARDYRPALVADDLTVAPRAAWILEELEAIGPHGLEPAEFLHDETSALISLQRELAIAAAALPEVSPSRAELRAILSALEALPATDPVDAPRAALARVLAGSVPLGDDTADLWAAHQARVEVLRLARGHAALVELAVIDAAAGYALRQRLGNTDAIDRTLDDAGKARLIATQVAAFIQQLAQADTPDSVAAVFAALPPALPQYPLLLQARARYAGIVARGGWEPIDGRSVRRGARGPIVEQLKRRFAAEGYWSGPIDDSFDGPFEDAFQTYQRTHQLEEDGTSSRDFWTSLNVSAQDRLRQIDLTLQRWRESRIGDDTYYVSVNVPDFHAEVWRNGVRDLRFRVVVGNTQRVCDPLRRRMVYANATPLQSADMTTVVVNPTWTVPRRIVEEELLPSLMEDPTYFERNGFERLGESSFAVRQRPGGSNPLGRAKFIFPNDHNTYMHDTARPQYFQFPVRAFSHGCIRVDRPMELLEYVLTQDGQYDERAISRVFRGTAERGYTLNTPIPVHIEYYVVRVDDDGQVHFLSDIYRYDRRRLDPDFVANERCRPPPQDARLVLGDGNTVRYRDTDGNEYTPAQWEYVRAGGTLARRDDGTFEDPPPGSEGGVAAGDIGP